MTKVDFYKAFKDKEKLVALSESIKKDVEKIGKEIRVMEFCGGHTHALLRYGIDELLKGYIKFFHGPGCPVCVLPQKRVDLALELAKEKDVYICTYGDVLRVPGSAGKTLLDMRAEFSNVFMVYSCLDSIEIALKNPSKKVIFFAIGFETTTPQTAVLIKIIKEKNIKNLFVVSNHILTPAVVDALLSTNEKVNIDAFIGPGHVSTITGFEIYDSFVKAFNKPIVISGFEPLDLLLSISLIAKQILSGEFEVQNAYKRAVSKEGNIKAKSIIGEIFEERDFEWRGLGRIKNSGLKIRKEFESIDAESIFDIALPPPKEAKDCICGLVLRGIREPFDCKLFGKECNPSNPVGSCMVSSEGACAAYFKYKSNKNL